MRLRVDLGKGFWRGLPLVLALALLAGVGLWWQGRKGAPSQAAPAPSAEPLPKDVLVVTPVESPPPPPVAPLPKGEERAPREEGVPEPVRSDGGKRPRQDPFLYEAKVVRSPSQGGPPLPPVPVLPGLPPVPPPVEVLGLASGQGTALALAVGGEVVVLRVGERLVWKEGEVQHVLVLKGIGPKEASVQYNGQTFMLRLGGGL